MDRYLVRHPNLKIWIAHAGGLFLDDIVATKLENRVNLTIARDLFITLFL
ncbi:MAG: hypothetical protein ACOC5F_06195 [Candidatus Aminicenantaceae bacterium]